MSDGLFLLVVLGAYFALQRWVLPRMGVHT
jgi:hypothetical protein